MKQTLLTLLFSTIFVCFLIAQDENNNCPAPSGSSIDNITANNFDLNWSAAPGAISYGILATLNGGTIHTETTAATSTTIFSPTIFSDGDILYYEIWTNCENGSSGDTLKATYNIIATVDVVMMLDGSDDQDCIICPYAVKKLPKNSKYTIVYDCECLKNDYSNCKGRSIAITTGSCMSENQIVPINGYFYPNPFDISTSARFELPEKAVVNLSIFDIRGSKILTIIDGEAFEEGTIEAAFNGIDLQKGIYFYHFNAGNYMKTGKLIKL